MPLLSWVHLLIFALQLIPTIHLKLWAMLAIFHKAFAHPPEELNSPASRDGSRKPKLPEETLREFLSAHPANTFSMSFGTAAALAYVSPDRSYPTHQRYICWLQKLTYVKYFFYLSINWGIGFGFFRLFGGFDDIYCLFMGSLNNLCILNRQYGLSKGSNEAILVIEAYRTLRDRGPYPADQVVKDLEGSFAFVVYDSKAGTVFTALVNIISFINSPSPS